MKMSFSEDLREQKSKRIGELLLEKNVEIQDDFYEDIFNKAGTYDEIFRAMSPRMLDAHPEKIDETLDYIIEQLELL